MAVRGWKRRRVDAATERRRHEADCPLPRRTWRELRAKGAGPIAEARRDAENELKEAPEALGSDGM